MADNKHSNQAGKQKSLQPGSSSMGKPSVPPVRNYNYSAQTHFYTNRTHDPKEKMKSWFTHDQERKASSWMSDSNLEPNSSNIGVPVDFWDNDSDDFISQIMNEKFEENLIKASQEARALKSGPSLPSNKPSGLPKSSFVESKLTSQRKVEDPKKATVSYPAQGRGLQNKPGPAPSTLNLSARSSSSSSILSESERKLSKPSRSFNLSNPSQSLTTEWLRNQLEKVNKECRSLKENITAKEGEGKILREKLKDAKITIEKQKMDKEMECLNIKTMLEEKIKALKKDLQQAHTQILLKTKEAEANIERYKELKKINVREPQYSQSFSTSQSFKKFINRSGKPKTSLDASTQQIDFPHSPIPLHTRKSVDVQNISTQTDEAMEITDSAKESSHEIVFDFNLPRETLHCGSELSSLINPIIFKEAKSEFSILIPPAIDYYPFEILFKDLSEIPVDDNDDWSVNDNLARLWNVEECKAKRKNPKEGIRKSRYFTSLSDINSDILELCNLQTWCNTCSVDNIIEHITKMARELYIAFRDPEVSASRTIRSREIETYYKCLDMSELDSELYLFSPEPYKKELYVDLRRGIALVAALCDIDQDIQKFILENGNFIAGEYSRSNKECFTEDEKCYINCITDTFTFDFVNRTTFLHHRSTEFESKKIKDIKKREKKKLKKLNQDKLFGNLPQCSSAEKEAPVQRDPLSELSSISAAISSKMKGTSKKPKELPPSYDRPKETLEKHKKYSDLMVFLESKIERSLAICTKANGGENMDIQETSNREEKHDASLIDLLMKKEIEKWSAPGSSNTNKIRDEIIKTCTSQGEKELYCSTFSNFLQIKASVESDDVPLADDVDVDNDGNDPNLADYETTQVRKRKMSPEPQPSTSKDDPKTFEASKKHDLAPLKKHRKDEDVEEQMDTQEIQNELEGLYKEDTPMKPIEDSGVATQKIESDKTLAQDEPQTALSSKHEDESGQMYVYLYPEEIASQCQLLGILLEIVRSIGCFRYSVRFNALLAAIVKLLSSLKKCCYMLADRIKSHYLCTMILEIIYCRPSPYVLLKIHTLLVDYMSITGFSRLICHNAHPGKFVKKRFKIEFKRGACLLSMMCAFTELYTDASNWDIQYQFIKWVAYLFLVDVNVIIRLYRRQKSTCGQCSCVQCLDNCIIKVLTSAVVSYYTYWSEKNFSPLVKFQLNVIITQGIKILSVLVDLDKFLVQNLSNNYRGFSSFLKIVNYFHISEDIDFSLEKVDFQLLTYLLEEKVAKKIDKRYNHEVDLKMASNLFAQVNCNLRANLFSIEKSEDT